MGEVLEDIAKRYGFNRSEISRKLGMSQKYWYSLIRRKHIDKDMILRIEEITGVDLHKYFDLTKNYIIKFESDSIFMKEPEDMYESRIIISELNKKLLEISEKYIKALESMNKKDK